MKTSKKGDFMALSMVVLFGLFVGGTYFGFQAGLKQGYAENRNIPVVVAPSEPIKTRPIPKVTATVCPPTPFEYYPPAEQ